MKIELTINYADTCETYILRVLTAGTNKEKTEKEFRDIIKKYTEGKPVIWWHEASIVKYDGENGGYVMLARWGCPK